MIFEVIDRIEEEVLEQARQIREDLHRHPELAFSEHRTAEAVARHLDALGLDAVTRGVAGTGVVGLLQGGRPGNCVALRAELDGLPIEEQTGLPYASQNRGVMHACGHDGHMAILLGCARVLSEMREKIPGAVKFIFQPAEELGGGAERMVEAGVLRDPEVAAIFALHARPQLGPGQIELCDIPGAASNPFEIRVVGRGCHAAYPHVGIDPIVVGCRIVDSLQQVVSRQVAPGQQAVVTVGAFSAGDRGNVIPAEALLRGTIRTREPGVQKQVVASVRRIAESTAAAFGALAEVRIEDGCPRLKNDAGLTRLAGEVGRRVLGPGNVLECGESTMGADDFAYYLEEQGGVPGCLFRLGVATDVPVHSAGFDFGHEALRAGILMVTNLAIGCLSGG